MAIQKNDWFRAITPTFFTSLGLILATASILGFGGWFVVGGCLIVALFPAGIVLGWIDVKSRKFKSFFGFSDSFRVNLILSSYMNRVDYSSNSEETSKRYKKRLGDGLIYLEGARDYLSGLETAKTSSLTAFKIGNFNIINDINVIGDEEHMTNLNGPIICLGSTTSNFFTEEILKKLPIEFEIKFTTNSMKCWLPHEEVLPDEKNDYAVLIRDQDINTRRVSFVCAGIDEEGTIAVVHHLFKNWQILQRDHGENRFVELYRCNKRDLGVKCLSGSNW